MALPDSDLLWENSCQPGHIREPVNQVQCSFQHTNDIFSNIVALGQSQDKMGDIKISVKSTARTLQKIKGINYQLGQSRPVLDNASRNRFMLYNLLLLFMQMHLRSQSQLRPEFPYICPKLLPTSLGTI
jgi:hypothetical protein